MTTTVQAVLISCGSWHLRQTARAFQHRNALAGLYVSDKNTTGIQPELFHRCWSFHLAMKPFYKLFSKPTVWWEPVFWSLFPLWKNWLLRRQLPPCNVVQAISPFATEAFDMAERIGALKVFDAPNSHPITQTRIMEREFAKWSPGTRMPAVTRWYVPRATRDIRRADVVLCPSRFVLDSMVENGIPQGRCLVIPYGVDTRVFKRRLNAPPRPRFVSVGDVCVRKGHPCLFAAFDRLQKKIPEAELVCVGSARPDCASEIRKWKDRVTFIKHLSHSELAELFQTCTAFVLVSVEEGYARVLSEALSAGLPIVATHETGATTTIRDGSEGFIVKAGDIEGLAHALFQLASDRELCESMGRRARETGAIGNTWQDYGDRLLEELAQRLPGTRSSGVKR